MAGAVVCGEAWGHDGSSAERPAGPACLTIVSYLPPPCSRGQRALIAARRIPAPQASRGAPAGE
ncbi:MAG TPA: hypothetical protein VGG35_23280 [Streptosporangiaceae bacterium]